MTTVDTTDSSSAEPSRYTFAGNIGEHAAQQRRVLGEILDEHTVDVLSRVGVASGWRCLDLGAGAGSITAWLANQVGPGGHVTALDLDTHQIQAADNVTVVTGDVRGADVRETSFDLIHARTMLVFLPDRERIVQKLAGALKPGGTLVISDFAEPATPLLLHSPSPPAAEAYDLFQRLVPVVMQANGGDPYWGRRVPLAVRAAGLIDVNTVVHTRLWYGGQAGNLLHLHNSYLLQEALLARGMTTDQLDLLRVAMVDPQTMAYLYPLHTTTGRKPS